MQDEFVLHQINFKHFIIFYLVPPRFLYLRLYIIILFLFFNALLQTHCFLDLARPDDTPWEGGTFRLKLEFSEEYPNKPPKVSFVSAMFHPNVYNDGSICLDILQNQWSPIYDVAGTHPLHSHLRTRTYDIARAYALVLTRCVRSSVAAILTSIQSLLCDPNPNSPANAEAARLFAENKREYNRRVKDVVERSWEDVGA